MTGQEVPVDPALRAARRRVLVGGGSAVLSTVLAAGLTGLVWKFPVFMVGIVGGIDGFVGGMVTALLWLTLMTLFLGGLLIFALGAASALPVRTAPTWMSIAAGSAVGVLVAVGYALIGVLGAG